MAMWIAVTTFHVHSFSPVGGHSNAKIASTCEICTIVQSTSSDEAVHEIILSPKINHVSEVTTSYILALYTSVVDLNTPRRGPPLG